MNADTYENFSKFPEIGGSIVLNDQTKTDLSADQTTFLKERLKAFIKKETKRSVKKAIKKALRKNRKKKRKFVKWEKVKTCFKKMGDILLKKFQKVIPGVIIGGITTGITKVFSALTAKLFQGRRCSIS